MTRERCVAHIMESTVDCSSGDTGETIPVGIVEKPRKLPRIEEDGFEHLPRPPRMRPYSHYG